MDVFIFDNSQLNINEVVNTNKINKQKYSYHYMDKNKNLIFRYDNVPYHRTIGTFPHHKHTDNGVFESVEPNLDQVLEEVENTIQYFDNLLKK